MYSVDEKKKHLKLYISNSISDLYPRDQRVVYDMRFSKNLQSSKKNLLPLSSDYVGKHYFPQLSRLSLLQVLL